jgi:medium-chain acyl-[acyl-carrier-protein] hydrolase
MATDVKRHPNHWFGWPKPNPLARMRLFCFPYAGGSAIIYRTWPDLLTSSVELCAINLPGRGARLREAPFTRVSVLVREIATAIRPFFDKPFAFFGHSMGALISFELARQLRLENQAAPVQLFLSGCKAPHLPDNDPPTFGLPDGEFVKEIRRLNGTPNDLLENPELMQLMIPLLRADFAICQTYEYRQEPPLDFPITVFGGLEDHLVPRSHLEAWRQHTNAAFKLRMLPGSHFFLNSEQRSLLNILSQELSEYLRRLSPSAM